MPYLLWREDERSEIRTVQELDELVDRLTLEAKADMPFTVELHTADETLLCIVIGREESHVLFHSATSSPPILSSLGPWDDDEPIEFTYQEQESSVPKRFTVPIEDAREALRLFYQTGTRPDNIAWNWWR
jgi:hypothetical protein